MYNKYLPLGAKLAAKITKDHNSKDLVLAYRAVVHPDSAMKNNASSKNPSDIPRITLEMPVLERASFLTDVLGSRR